MSDDRIPCPVCIHEETMRARLLEREPCYDDHGVMCWSPPVRMGGQSVTRWDHGAWTCDLCGASLTPHDASVLLDAALMHYDPHCDSIADGVHADVRRAQQGGEP